MKKAFLLFILSIFLFTLQQPVSADVSFFKKLVDAALERTKLDVTYDGSYYKISYPNGDVPADKGVCTDVVVRSYRTLGIDLQQEVHEDMQANFDQYPKIWGMESTDTNIDHRRVPNLQTFFSRNGKKLKNSKNPKDYKPGDIVTWNLTKNGSMPHIGIVSNLKSYDGKRFLIIHNIGQGPKIEDMLFQFDITGHYRYEGK